MQDQQADSADPRSTRLFWIFLFLLLALALGHSLWSTSADGFTIDEPYHIAAGASYIRWGDFRLNPEHPPLVKLIAGLSVPPSVLHLVPLQLLHEKDQEREYTQRAVYLESDTSRIQRRARAALFTLNLVLLGVLTFLLRRVFGRTIAMAALLLLALDPTVSAHLPVVMTDLPLALLGTICVCLAILALRDGQFKDWVFLGIAGGLLLATKHSAPLIAVPLVIGSAAAILWRLRRKLPMRREAAGLAAAGMLSLVVLWGTYGFRYHETPGSLAETFNRPLTAKIADLHSPFLRSSLTTAQTLHLVPRAYIWGLADTLRAGVEGRPTWIAAFGYSYQGKAPWWVPLADLLVKLPIAFLLLTIFSLGLLLLGRYPAEIALPLACVTAMAAFFLLFIAHNGIFYAGLRHWLFEVPLLTICAAAGASFLWRSPTVWLRALPWIAILWIAIDVLPQRRIWEYHNMFAGGSHNAWKSFDNESVDLGQRAPEFVRYYQHNIAPAPVMIGYWILPENLKAGHVNEWEPKPEEVGDGKLNGWLCLHAPDEAIRDWHDMPSMRDVPPTARFGNLFVYHGSFSLPRVAAGILRSRALHTIDQVGVDKKLVEQYLLRSIALDPDAASAAIELGNFALARRENEQALHWYELARKDAADKPDILADVQQQILRVRQAPPNSLLAPLRNPSKE